MTTISVPIPHHMLEFIEREVKMGNFENKAAVVRKAISKFREDVAYESLLRAEKDIEEGRIFKGDLDELVKKLKL